MLTIIVKKHISFLNGTNGIFEETHYADKIRYDNEQNLLWVYQEDYSTYINLAKKNEKILSIDISIQLKD